MIRLLIESDLSQVCLIGVSVKAICLELGCGPPRAAELELCVVEAVNNVIEYSYQNMFGYPIEVRLQKNNGSFIIEVIDSGVPMDDLIHPNLSSDQKDIDTLSEAGLGFFIIFNLMDAVSYYSKNNKNHLCMTAFYK